MFKNNKYIGKIKTRRGPWLRPTEKIPISLYAYPVSASGCGGPLNTYRYLYINNNH